MLGTLVTLVLGIGLVTLLYRFELIAIDALIGLLFLLLVGTFLYDVSVGHLHLTLFVAAQLWHLWQAVYNNIASVTPQASF